MRYELHIQCINRDEAFALRDLISDLISDLIGGKCEIVTLSDAEDYRRMDVSGWPMAKYLLSRMEPGRYYERESLALILEDMGWSKNSLPTLLVKLTAQGYLKRTPNGLYRKAEKNETME